MKLEISDREVGMVLEGLKARERQMASWGGDSLAKRVYMRRADAYLKVRKKIEGQRRICRAGGDK